MAIIDGSCDASFVFCYDGGIECTGNAEHPDYEESEDKDEDVVGMTESPVGTGELGHGLHLMNEPKEWEKH